MQKMCTRKLVLRSSYLISVNRQNQPIQVRNSFLDKIFCKGIIKNTKKELISFFSLKPVPLNWYYWEKQKGFGTNYQPSFSFLNISKIYHLVDLDILIQISFRLIHKIPFTNLCKTYHDVIIIAFLSFHCEQKKIRGEEKELRKMNNWRTKRTFKVIKKHFSYFLRAFIWWNFKK